MNGQSMRRTTHAVIIAVVAGYELLGLSTVHALGRAEEPAVLKTRPPSGVDLASLARESRWLELMAAASEAVRQNASDPAPMVYQIQALRMLGQTDAALKRAVEAAERFPESAAVILERAWVHLFQSDWPKALFDGKRAEEIDPRLSAALIVQGIACREMHNWDQVVMVYTKVLAQTPDDANALLNRGRAYVEAGLWDKAKADLTRSISLNGSSADAYYHRGRAYAGQGKLADAAKDLTSSITLGPEATAPYIARAEAFARGGKWDASAKDAYTAIALGSNDVRPYLTACQASIALGDFDALAEYANGGIGLSPDSPEFHRFRGRACREKGELNTAS